VAWRVGRLVEGVLCRSCGGGGFRERKKITQGSLKLSRGTQQFNIKLNGQVVGNVFRGPHQDPLSIGTVLHLHEN
jgi:hypothetical protein